MCDSRRPGAGPGRRGGRTAALSAAIVATLGLSLSGTASADPDPELDALKQQVQELQRKIDALAKQQAAAPATVPAAAAPAKEAAPAQVGAARPDGPLSMYGVTLYGTIDVNVVYQTHGTPLSDYHPAGTYAYIQKNSNNAIFTLSDNGLSVSKIGLTGDKEILNGWSGIFRLESGFNPLSGNLVDALKSLTVNNGRALTAQTTGADSSFAGELFNTAAFAGLSHKRFGTVTFGRQNGLLADGAGTYDPMQGSQAFSVIGISGTAPGGGSTENRRLDNSVKYNLQADALHVAALYQFNGATGQPGSAYQLTLGGIFAQGSVDAFYSKKYDAITSTSLTAAQVATLNCPYSYTLPSATVSPQCVGVAGVATAGGGFNPIDKSLAGTISDNTAFAVMGRYSVDKLRLYGGYEHISYSNPQTPLAAGTQTIGGYVLAYVNQQTGAASTYAIEKVVQYWWVGGKYSFSKAVDWTVAWYHFEQGAFATGANAGCNDARAANCQGSTNAISTLLDWRLSQRFDTYAGAEWSEAKDGMANGFLYRTTINPTIGIRYTF
ncbi:MAG TPA: porin [Steroidobacteraceae bacterium]|nr:porin [Steroidobacteraceae bacterium]